MKSISEQTKGSQVAKLPMVWTYDGNGICILIPSKNGSKYLRQPIGHYRNELAAFIEEEIRYNGSLFPTVYGIDGYVYMPITLPVKSEEQIENQIMIPLCNKYKWYRKFLNHSDFMDLVIQHH